MGNGQFVHEGLVCSADELRTIVGDDGVWSAKDRQVSTCDIGNLFATGIIAEVFDDMKFGHVVRNDEITFTIEMKQVCSKGVPWNVG